MREELHSLYVLHSFKIPLEVWGEAYTAFPKRFWNKSLMIMEIHTHPHTHSTDKCTLSHRTTRISGVTVRIKTDCIQFRWVSIDDNLSLPYLFFSRGWFILRSAWRPQPVITGSENKAALMLPTTKKHLLAPQHHTLLSPLPISKEEKSLHNLTPTALKYLYMIFFF